MRAGTLIQILLLGTLCAQDSVRSSPSYAKWSSTLGLTSVYAAGFNITMSYQFADEVEFAMIRIRPHLTVGVHQDDWMTEEEIIGGYNYQVVTYEEQLNYYGLYYAMLEGYIPVLETRNADLHFTLGGGLGRYNLYRGSEWIRNGASSIVSMGLGARYRNMIGATGLVYHNEIQRPAYTVSLGYQTDNPLKAVLLPLGFYLGLVIYGYALMGF